MRLGIVLVVIASALVPAGAAHGQNRSFCTDRIDAEAPVCAPGPGEAIVEVTALSYDRSSDPTYLNHTLVLADTLVRLGLDDATELQIGLAGLVHAVTHERGSGRRESATGVGDGYLALRHTIDEVGAVEAYVTLPSGSGPAGAGTWGAGLTMAIDLPSPVGVQLYTVPQIEALPDASGGGRHLAYGGTLGVARNIGRDMVGTLELHAVHDLDPAGHGINAQLAGALTWQLTPRAQINAAAQVGIAHDAPRGTLLLGIALGL